VPYEPNDDDQKTGAVSDRPGAEKPMSRPWLGVPQTRD
jgi:hypothetical protein